MASTSTNSLTKSTTTLTNSADGVIIIDKPSGWTSHDVVAKVRSLLKVKKVGHTGTLDPFATGVLPLTIGKATRLTNYFISSDKTYHGIMRFGFATSTYDIEGEPLGEDIKPDLDRAKLEEIFSRFQGTFLQTIPSYSAKKVDGRPLYEYARKGIAMAPSTKEVTVKSLLLLGVNGCEAEFELACAAGTYARSLAHDIGAEYGCGAHLTSLRRTRSGVFAIEAAVQLSNDEGFLPSEILLNRLLPLRDLLQEVPSIVISGGDRDRLLHGMDLNLIAENWEAEEYRLIDDSGGLIAIAKRTQTFDSPVDQPVRWIRIHPQLTFK
jgi:tRNA pseudouridine55 synthase